MELYYQTSNGVTLSISVNGTLTDADTTPNNPMVYLTVTRLSDSNVILNNVEASKISTGIYQYVLTANDNASLGRYRIDWVYTLSGVNYNKTQYYDVVVGYTTAQEVKDEFPELSTYSNDQIYRKEKISRKIINVFCGQTFDFEANVIKKIRTESGTNHLLLPRRIYDLVEVTLDDDTSSLVADLEIESDFYIRPLISTGFVDIKRDIMGPTTYFVENTAYDVTGNWGWESVPEAIQESSRLLINDYFDDDSLLRQHGIISSNMGDTSFTLKNDLWATTGNYDVDIMLSDYIHWGVSII